MQKLQRGSMGRQGISGPIRWKGCDAVRLTNGAIEMIALAGGGHLASFRFLSADPCQSQNVLWEPPWATREPNMEWSDEMARQYGPPETGRFLAGFRGHALCLDYFGDPPETMRAQNLGLHGEAAAVKWSTADGAKLDGAQCRWTARLPISQLMFEREIRLGAKESVAYIEETVTNERNIKHTCDWVQHVTFGPPFLCADEGKILASASSGMTSPDGYEGKSLLPDGACFSWPYAPCRYPAFVADLRRPFVEQGRGFLAGLMLDPSRRIEFLLAINSKSRLGVGYCFRRSDFPWMAAWEENCARKDAPWKGSTQARGMEFGTKPLPIPRHDSTFGKNFNTPTRCVIARRGKRIARYLMFLFTMPAAIQSIDSIADVAPSENAICFRDIRGDTLFSLPAKGCETFLAEK